jgi:hypothetical protein
MVMMMEVVVLLLLCLVLWWWQARVMLGWHKEALYCGRCGSKTLSYLSGQRRVCSKCNNKLYPRIDPVRILSLSQQGQSFLLAAACMLVFGFEVEWNSSCRGFFVSVAFLHYVSVSLWRRKCSNSNMYWCEERQVCRWL